MEKIREYIWSQGIDIYSLIHDGLITSACSDQLLRGIEDYIAQHGWDIRLAEKPLHGLQDGAAPDSLLPGWVVVGWCWAFCSEESSFRRNPPAKNPYTIPLPLSPQRPEPEHPWHDPWPGGQLSQPEHLGDCRLAELGPSPSSRNLAPPSHLRLSVETRVEGSHVAEHAKAVCFVCCVVRRQPLPFSGRPTPRAESPRGRGIFIDWEKPQRQNL